MKTNVNACIIYDVKTLYIMDGNENKKNSAITMPITMTITMTITTTTTPHKSIPSFRRRKPERKTLVTAAREARPR